jgi:hypothetical protein
MRQPIRAKASKRQQIAAVQSYPAPVGGWNARDALAAMKPTDAVRLENWFPLPTYCEIRGGEASHGTGLTGNVETVAVYNKLTGQSLMFGMTNSGVWDVSSAGAGVLQTATSTNGRWQYVNFGDGTNNYLINCNGVDKPLYYDGTTWLSVDSGTSPALSGITSSNLIYPMVYKGRLFFIEKASLSFWYLAAGAAGGALTEFDLSAESTMGGYLVAMINWTFDGGDGQDDYAVFVTSEGQVHVYAGNNPSSATAWSKKGTFNLGQPLGRRCLLKYGGDVLYLSQIGALPLSVYLQSTVLDKKLPLTDKITNAFTDAARTYGGNFGWEGTYLPAHNAMIFNVPTAEDISADQYVMNVITRAWCKFTGWNANTFAVFNGELYYGASGVVYKAWTGASDLGANIVADAKSAFSYFGNALQEKQFVLFRPILSVNGTLSFLTGLDTDFNETPISGTATYSVTGGALWDVALWDQSYWAANLQVQKAWTSPQENMGYSAAGKLKIATNSLTVQWMSSDYVYQHAGVIG